MTKIIDGTVTKVDSPSHRSNFDDEPILFGEDLEVIPILFPIGEGEKLSWAQKVFRTSRKTLERAAKQFRFYDQGKANATIWIYMPAYSAIISKDWQAYRDMQSGDFHTDLVKAHLQRIQQREEAMRRADIINASAVKPKKVSAPAPKQGQLRLVSG